MRKTSSAYSKSPVLLFVLLLFVVSGVKSSKEIDTTTVESVEEAGEEDPINNGGETDCALICNLEPDAGSCARYGKKFRRWAFYSEENECKTLYYGGCKGNSNRFWSKTECEAECQDCIKKASSTTSESKANET